MDRLKVLVAAYAVDANDVGEIQMVYKWVRHLSEKVDLTLITTGSRLHEECGLEHFSNIELITVKNAISFRRWDAFDRGVHPGYVEYFWRARNIVKDLVRRQAFDICHHLAPFSLRYPTPLIDVETPLIVGPIYGGLRPPAIMKQLKAREGALEKLRAVDGIRMRIDPYLVKHYRKARKILLSAPYVKALLPMQYKDKTGIVSGIAVDEGMMEEIHRSPAKKSIDLIAVSRIVAAKGLELLICGLAECKNRSRVKLHIYGRGPLEDEYRQLTRKLAIEENVIWHGFVPNKKVVSCYKNMDVFALPSLKEPAGIAVLEAMAKGLPVLCVDAGGPGYSVTDRCGIKIRLADKDTMIRQIAHGVDSLAGDAKRRIMMGREAQERIRNEFTWEAVTDKTVALYESIACGVKT